MSGKAKCEVLKQIRKNIADANGIPLEIPECTNEGECSGTCPRCEAEVRYLERELEKREESGLMVKIGRICEDLVWKIREIGYRIHGPDELVGMPLPDDEYLPKRGAKTIMICPKGHRYDPSYGWSCPICEMNSDTTDPDLPRLSGVPALPPDYNDRFNGKLPGVRPGTDKSEDFPDDLPQGFVKFRMHDNDEDEFFI